MKYFSLIASVILGFTAISGFSAGLMQGGQIKVVHTGIFTKNASTTTSISGEIIDQSFKYNLTPDQASFPKVKASSGAAYKVLPPAPGTWSDIIHYQFDGNTGVGCDIQFGTDVVTGQLMIAVMRTSMSADCSVSGTMIAMDYLF